MRMVNGLRQVAVAIVAGTALLAEEPPSAQPFVPETATLAARTATQAYAKGDYKQAVVAFKELAQAQPNDPVVLVNLGLAQFMAGDAADAEETLKAALQRQLDAGPAWLTLGMLYLEQDRTDEAVAALAQAAVHDPGSPRARNFLGVAAGRKGWLDAAESELRRATAIDPNFAEAHYNLAVICLERKPPAVELARRHYQRAR